MRKENPINPIQAEIIWQLFTRDELRFSELQPDGVLSDQFSYHLKQLTKQNIVEKTDDSTYQLSVIGRTRAIMLDKKSKSFIQQGFVAARVILKKEENNEELFLIQERTKVPYKGYIGEPGGKVLFGEDVLESARRNMKYETGLDCDVELRGLIHLKDDYKGNIQQDKYFFIVLATNPTGDLKKVGETGLNYWMKRQDVLDHAKLHHGVEDMFRIVDTPGFEFCEKTTIVEEY